MYCKEKMLAKIMMLLIVCFVILNGCLVTVESAPFPEEFDDLKDVNVAQKRSGGGSFDFFSHIKSGLIGGVGRASAAVAAGSSGTSSSSSPKGHDESPHHSNSIDPISLKKSVLNTLFQAVKAITGGVTAIKGQLIKGSGYALSAGGQLIAASGDKITDVGAGIVSSAKLIPPESHGSSSHPFLSKFGGFSSSSAAKNPIGGTHTSNIIHHGTSDHSESVHSIGHSSYGPPPKSPSYSSIEYLPPSSGGYSDSNSGHYSAFEGPSSSLSYLPTKYGIPFEGQNDYGGTLDRKEAHSAIEALKEIVHLLPKTKTKDTTNVHETHTNANRQPYFSSVEQFAIPIDPIYSPIETISHSNSVTSYSNPPSFASSGLQSGPKAPEIQPYDLYHTMMIKYGLKSPSGSNSFPKYGPPPSNGPTKDSYGNFFSPNSSYRSAPPLSSAVIAAVATRSDQPQIKQYNSVIQKSIGYVIKDPRHFNKELLH